MARLGGSRHLKRLAAPAFWPIARKEFKWAVKPSCGPHPTSRSFPLLIAVRDLLKYAETSREARRLISEGHFKVDGVIRTNYRFPVGLMDVIEVVDTGETFRVMPAPVDYLTLVPISKEEASYKLCRIENKTVVKGGHIQLNLHDGRNVLIRVSNPVKPAEDVYKTMGTLKLTVPGQQILKYVPISEKVLVIVIDGRNVGKVGRLLNISPGMRRYRRQVKIEGVNKEVIYTTLDKIFVIGEETPEITMPQMSLGTR